MSDQLSNIHIIDTVLQKIKSNKPAVKVFPHGACLHIERQVPYIVVFKKTGEETDKTAVKLIRSEVSTLILSSGEEDSYLIRPLLKKIISFLSREFGSFIVLELEVYKDQRTADNGLFSVPEFRIFHSKTNPPYVFIDTLETELEKYYISRVRPDVIKFPFAKQEGLISPSLRRLFPASGSFCYFVTLQLNPFFINPGSQIPYPLLFKKLISFLTRSIRRALYDFIQTYTSHRPVNYQALGKRSFVKNVREIDQKIALLGSSFEMLFLVTPDNVEQAWKKFFRSGFQTSPQFRYRPVPVNPAVLKRALYSLPVNNINDPVLYQVFSEKQREMERQISMIQDRGTRNFLPGSIQVYGSPDKKLCDLAIEILNAYPVVEEPLTSDQYYTSGMLKKYAEKELLYYKMINSDFSFKISVDPNIAGILVSQGNLYIGKHTKISKTRIKSLLNHEIGTHILTYFNALAQPLRLLRSGFAGYEELQEGIAVLSEYLTGGLTPNRLRLLAGRVLAVQYMIQGADFIETFRTLKDNHGFSSNLSYIISMRTFRGGGFTKDIIYLKGFIRLIKFLKKTEHWEQLFYGKISQDQLPLIYELESRKMLNPVPLIPRYMALYKEKADSLRLVNYRDVLGLSKQKEGKE